MLNFILGLLGNLLAAEIGAWCPHFAQKLIARAVSQLPISLAERMHEEWSALLNDTRGDLSKLAVAVSLYWKRSQIAEQWENEDVREVLLPPLVLQSLSETEAEVFELTTEGLSVGEITVLLSMNRTAIEYVQIMCARKLGAQTAPGRNDVVNFFARTKYKQSELSKILSKFKRDRLWRRLERSNDYSHWKANQGW